MNIRIQVVGKIIEEIIADNGYNEYFERIRRCFTKLLNELDNTDPMLIPNLDSQLNNVDNWLSNLLNYLTNYRVSHNIQELINAQGYVENLLSFIATLSFINGKKDFEGVKQTVTSLRRSAQRSIQIIEERKSRVEQELEKTNANLKFLSDTIEAQKSRLDSFLTNANSSFNQNENQRTDTSAQAEMSRRSAYDESEKRRRVEFEELLDSMSERFESDASSFQDQAHKHIAEIRKAKEQAEELLGVIGHTGMAHGYKQYADEEREKESIWGKVAVAAFIGLILATCAFYFLMPNMDLSWTNLFFRLFIASIFLILGWYAATKSHNHGQMKKMYRRLELELTSINPYLATLDIDKRRELIERFADKYFGQIQSDLQQQEVGVKSPVEMVKEIAAMKKL